MREWFRIALTVFVVCFLVLSALRATESYSNPLYVICLGYVGGFLLFVLGGAVYALWQLP